MAHATGAGGTDAGGMDAGGMVARETVLPSRLPRTGYVGSVGPPSSTDGTGSSASEVPTDHALRTAGPGTTRR